MNVKGLCSSAHLFVSLLAVREGCKLSLKRRRGGPTAEHKARQRSGGGREAPPPGVSPGEYQRGGVKVRSGAGRRSR